MLNIINDTSADEKLYMLCYYKNFSLPIRSNIILNTSSIKQEVYKRFSNDVIEKILDKSTKFYSKENIKKIFMYSNDSRNSSIVVERLSRIIDMPCETKEDIINIFSIFNTIFPAINGRDSLLTESYKISIIKYFFNTIIDTKLKAHEIYELKTEPLCSLTSTDKASYVNTLRYTLMELINNKHSYQMVSIMIYNILKYLDIEDTTNTVLNTLVESCIILGYDKELLNDNLQIVLNQNNDTLELIDKIEDDDKDCYDNYINTIRNNIIDSNDKTKLSTKTNNGLLLIGDNVLNENCPVSRLLTEINILNSDHIKDYINNDKEITYTIPEKDLGFLKLKQGVNLCKCMKPDNSFYSLANYDNKSYLLFKICNDDDTKCYGLSFPSEFGESRKMVEFEIPEDIDYKVSL